MLFGLLDDDTTLQEDPAKMALFGAGIGLIGSQGVTGADYLRDAIEGAGQGYGAFQQTRLKQAQMQAERQKQQLENAYKAQQIRKMQYEMGAAQRQSTKEAGERERQAQLKSQRMEQLKGLGLSPEEERLLLLQMDLDPGKTAGELGEMRNKLAQNRTFEALNSYMTKNGIDPVSQAVAQEIISNAGEDVAGGYKSALDWINEHAKGGVKADNTVDVEMFASTINTPWDVSGKVKETAMSMLERGQSVKAALDYISAMQEQMQPAEGENYKMSQSGNAIIYNNLKANKGQDNLWYGSDGQPLPGGFNYKRAADRKGMIAVTDSKASGKIYGSALGINLITNFSDLIVAKAESLGGVGNLSGRINAIFKPENLAELQTQYVEVLMSLKTSYELGALTGPDVGILEAAIKDPTSLGVQTAESMVRSLEVIRSRMVDEFSYNANKLNYDPATLLATTYAQKKPADIGLAPLIPEGAPGGRAGQAGATGLPAGINAGSAKALEWMERDRMQQEIQRQRAQ